MAAGVQPSPQLCVGGGSVGSGVWEYRSVISGSWQFCRGEGRVCFVLACPCVQQRDCLLPFRAELVAATPGMKSGPGVDHLAC